MPPPVHTALVRRKQREADPPPQDKAGAASMLQAFRTNPLGAWAGDRALQVTKNVNLVYIALNAIQDAYYGASISVLQRKQPSRQKTTFGPNGAFAKAMPAAHQQARDEEYTPFDDEDHPLVKRMRKPNDHQTMNQVLSYLTMQLGLTGEQFLWCVPNDANKPVEFYALPSALTYPQIQPGVDLRYPYGAYRVSPSYPGGGWGYAPGRLATTAIIPANEIKRDFKPHPYHLWSGYSPLTACAVAIDVLEALDKSRWAAMQHGPILDTVILLEGVTDQNVLDSVTEKMTKTHGGAENHRRHTTIGLPPGAKAAGALQNVGTNAKELDWVNSWKQIADLVLATYGVPPDVAGLEEAGSYSKLYANQQQFYTRHQNGAKKQGEFLTSAAAEPWCEFDGQYVVQVDLAKPQDHERLNAEITTDGNLSCRLVNEIRAARNLPPLPGGDVPPKVYEAMMMQKFAPPPAPAPGMEGEPQPGGEQPGNLANLMPKLKPQAKPQMPLKTKPTAGAVPRPTNPASAGSGVPRVGKALGASGMVGSEGGYLIPEPTGRMKRRKRTGKLIARVLKPIGG